MHADKLQILAFDVLSLVGTARALKGSLIATTGDLDIYGGVTESNAPFMLQRHNSEASSSNYIFCEEQPPLSEAMHGEKLANF